MYATLYVALQSPVYPWLEKIVVDELNGQAIDSTSVVGPAKRLIPESNDGVRRGPHSYTIELQAVQINLPAAGALQVHVHENSRVVSGIDTTQWPTLRQNLIAQI